MRNLRFVLALAAIVLVVVAGGCSPEDPFVPAKLQPPVGAPAFLRVIHGSPDAPPAVVYAGTTPLYGNLAQEYLKYPTGINEAKYYPVDTAAKTISFRGPGGVLASAPVAFREGKFYTAYLYGVQSDFRALVTTDTVDPPPGAATAVLRIVQLVPDAPELDVRLGANFATAVPLVEGIPYGSATRYISHEAVFPVPTGIFILDSKTKRQVFGIERAVYLPGNSIFTIVMTGRDRPSGDQPFMTFQIFYESLRDQKDGRYGRAPIPLTFAAIRLANLMPTQPDPTLGETIDCSLQDSSAPDWASNQFYRRNLDKQGGALCAIPPLGLDQSKGMQHIRPSMLLFLKKPNWPFRIEKNTPRSQYAEPQPVVIPGKPYDWLAGRRYTILAYGPYNPDSARSGVLLDNMPPAPGGRVLVRFFHGGYDRVDQKLKIRIGEDISRPMSYGEVPNDASDYFLTSPGATTIDLLDADDALLFQMEIPPNALQADRSYSILLSRGAYGKEYVLTPLSQDFDYWQ